MILNPTIFRAYDIRGIAFEDFDEEGIFLIGRSFGDYISKKFSIKNPKIFVSGDGRMSMDQIYPALLSGLKISGAEIIWGGILPTPINFFALKENNFDAAVQITASHNPPNYNGLKLTDKKGSICDQEIKKIGENAFCFDCEQIKKGKCIKDCEIVDFSEKYLKKILQISKNQKPKKIILDAGNGPTGIFYPEIFRKLGHDVLELFCDLDPTFPNHSPDPEEKENLQILIQKIKENNFDFGLAFDWDGDRIGIVLKNGEILSADKILFVLAADFLSRNPGETIVVDAMSSEILIEKIKKIGGKIILSKTGHSFIEEKMHEKKALFGGEQSGHFMFGENFYGHDDACLAGVRFLAAVEYQPKLLDEVINNWPQMYEFSKKFEVSDEKKFLIIEQVTKKLKKYFKNIDTLDGARIKFEDNDWAIIRCSNTSPKISVRIEAKEKINLEKYKKILVTELEESIKL